MQSKNGGWGAFDIDNTKYYLNYIPFADHGALLDPPTVDVSARCLSFLKQQNNPDSEHSINKGLKYLLSQQENDGSWYGRWGTNYIYGTWSVVSALNLLDFPQKEDVLKKPPAILKQCKDQMVAGEKMGSLITKVLKVIQKIAHPHKLRGQLWA